MSPVWVYLLFVSSAKAAPETPIFDSLQHQSFASAHTDGTARPAQIAHQVQPVHYQSTNSAFETYDQLEPTTYNKTEKNELECILL